MPSVGTGQRGLVRPGELVDHLGTLATAPRRGPAVRCHSVVERACIAFSMKIFRETGPVKAANSAISWRSAKAGGPAGPCVAWDRGTKWHVPVPVRLYLSRFNASLALADTPAPQAAAAIAYLEDASGCVTHTCTTTGCPRRYRRRSPGGRSPGALRWRWPLQAGARSDSCGVSCSGRVRSALGHVSAVCECAMRRLSALAPAAHNTIG